MPVPNQSAICVGSVIGSSTYGTIRLRRLFLAALISSLIWNWHYFNFLKKIVDVVYFEPTLRKSEVRILNVWS
jgi:phosphomevalonate kinase